MNWRQLIEDTKSTGELGLLALVLDMMTDEEFEEYARELTQKSEGQAREQ